MAIKVAAKPPQKTKRKAELEDITNSNLKKIRPNYKKHQQERSPPPSDTQTLSPPRPRQKSVTFELSNNRHYENSPLLTPKDEEDDFEEQQASLERSRHDPHNLQNNADYVALTSSLRVLQAHKERIENDIRELETLRLQNDEQTRDFFLKLVKGDLKLPRPARVLTAPVVDWSRYHHSLGDVQQCLNGRGEKPMFRTLNLFRT